MWIKQNFPVNYCSKLRINWVTAISNLKQLLLLTRLISDYNPHILHIKVIPKKNLPTLLNLIFNFNKSKLGIFAHLKRIKNFLKCVF